MKKLLFFFSTLLISMTSTKVFAHDIEVVNDDFVRSQKSVSDTSELAPLAIQR